MASIDRWKRNLGRLGLELRVLEREIGDGPDGVVGSWCAFVSPRGLPLEPIYFPPIGRGSNVERDLAIHAAVASYSAEELLLSPGARTYFESFFGGELPRFHVVE